jgi:hypothetical protein
MEKYVTKKSTRTIKSPTPSKSPRRKSRNVAGAMPRVELPLTTEKNLLESAETQKSTIQSKNRGGVVEQETLGTDRAALSPPKE